MIDHDRLFKQLLTSFFPDFIRLFFPSLAAHVNQESIEFLDKEIFSDIAKGERYHADLVVKTKYKSSEAFFLIHVEPQNKYHRDFAKRMYRYFSRLYEKYDLEVYPIAVLSYTRRKKQACVHEVSFPDLKVLRFEFRVLQLNQLKFSDYLECTNPVAVALVAKMNVAAGARAEVKLNCLKQLTRLDIDPARLFLVSQFIDTYLKLTKAQESEFQLELAASPEREEIMEIVTSWKREGLREGRREGRKEGRREEAIRLVGFMLQSKFGEIDDSTQAQVDELSVSQLERMVKKLVHWSTVDELEKFLRNLR